MSFGGGFMSGEQSSPSRGGTGGRKGPTTSLRPVTIHQINKAEQAHPDADFIIDSTEVGHLSFVGRVMSVQLSSASYLYNIHDGTGTVDVRQWTSTPGEQGGGEGGEGAITSVKEHDIVRVVGQIKTFNNKKHVAATHVRPIDDIMEDLYHIFDVIYTHNALTKGSSTKMAVDEKYNTQGDYAPRNVPVSGGIQTAGMPHLRRKIAEYFNSVSNPPDNGIFIDDIVKSCAPATKDQVREEVQNLISSGDLYSLDDDDHLASTG